MKRDPAVTTALIRATDIHGLPIAVQVTLSAPSAGTVRGGGRWVWAIPDEPTGREHAGHLLFSEARREPGVLREHAVPARWRLLHREMVEGTVTVSPADLLPGDTLASDATGSRSFDQTWAGAVVASTKPCEIHTGFSAHKRLTEPGVEVVMESGHTARILASVGVQVIR